MSDLTLFLIVIGTLLVGNIISLIFAVRKYAEFGPDADPRTKTAYTIYFLFLGVFYWFKTGCEKLIELIIKSIKK